MNPDTVVDHGVESHGWPEPTFPLVDSDRLALFEVHAREHAYAGEGVLGHTHGQPETAQEPREAPQGDLHGS